MRRSRAVLLVVLVLAGINGCSAEDTKQTQSGDTEARLDTSEPWDLVWFSDSLGAGVAETWADRIEEAEGVEVRVHNHTVGRLSLVQVREWLSERVNLREEVADAEIIVVYGNPMDSGVPVDTLTCVSTSKLPRDPPVWYSPADFEPYGDVLRETFDEIFDLRAGRPTVIRTFDELNGMLADWREAGIEAECTATWEAAAGAIREAADEYGVATASFYDEFNGVDHDEDARGKGYIASDGRHASPEGVLAQAEVLHALGYDPIVP